MTNLLDLDPVALRNWLSERGQKPFRARQVSQWLHQRFAADTDAMTDLAKPLRSALAAEATIRAPQVLRDTTAADGTRKWLLDAGGGNAVEAVYIPEADRGTLCISSQAGCALDCAFCSTGRQGFNRNLTTGEIVGQLWHANRTLLGDAINVSWMEAIRAEGPPRGANCARGIAAREPDGPSRGRTAECEARSTSNRPQAWGATLARRSPTS